MGSQWWRSVNEGLLRDAWEADRLLAGRPGSASRPAVSRWVQFLRRPSAQAWYRAHNSSVVAGYRFNDLNPAGTGQSLVTRFDVAPSSITHSLAQYTDYFANDYLATQINLGGLAVPRLPIDAGSVVLSFLIEALLISFLGGALGCLLVIPLNGLTTGAMNFQTFSYLAFAFRVTPDLLLGGVAFALFMGLVGGVPPAVRAARQPVSVALRSL